MFAEPKENQKALMQALCLRYPQLTYCHNHVIGISTLTSGSAAGTIADPKHVFSIALVANAVNIIIAHNHPSGSITPSFADFELTARIMVAGEQAPQLAFDDDRDRKRRLHPHILQILHVHGRYRAQDAVGEIQGLVGDGIEQGLNGHRLSAGILDDAQPNFLINGSGGSGDVAGRKVQAR